jgi:DNA repair exonuclease SbcCD nuclease subunit
MTYIVTSDLHLHAWSVFSHHTPEGINNRLAITLAELERAAAHAVKQDNPLMVIAGDIFHQRGVLDPEVLNPTRASFQRILAMGVSIIAMPGNHDLKSRETHELSSSIQNLVQFDIETMSDFKIYNEPSVITTGGKTIGLIPWFDTAEGLRLALETMAACADAPNMDVFIHAGIAGVLPGLKGALTPAYLQSLGFKRIFAGHYHNHKDLGGGVYSIGASTHHNWGDVSSLAGYLEVSDARVTFHDTLAPKFVDISGMDEDDIQLEAPGNYVRFRGAAMTQDDIKELQGELKKMGALGVSIQVPRAVVSARAASPTSSRTLDQSIADYVDADLEVSLNVDRKEVASRAAAILNDVRSVTEEV